MSVNEGNMSDRALPAARSSGRTTMNRTIAFFLFPGFQLVDLGAMTVFELANAEHAGRRYDLRIVSAHGGPVRSSAGATMEAQSWHGGDAPFDTMLVFGAHEPVRPDAHTVDVLRRAGSAARRIGTVCNGTALLAPTGLLDGRHVAVRAVHAAGLAARHPAIHVDAERVWIHDGKVWSSAGMTASIDLALALVEDDLGVDAALAVARRLVLYHWRSGTDAQTSPLLEMRPKSGRIRAALGYARSNLRLPLSIDALAEQANMSRRHFTRTFRAETGQSPARAIETMRAEVARTLLETSTLPLDNVAREAGFTSTEQMRTALTRVYRQTPQELRRRPD
jgi:transcriptional regulator GlxA family with amidase domain